jgi:hypothetical protein
MKKIIILSAYDKSGREINLKRPSLDVGTKILTPTGWETLTERATLHHSSEWNTATQAVDKETWIEDKSSTAAATAAVFTAYNPPVLSAEDAEYLRRAKERDALNRANNAVLLAARVEFSDSIAAGIASGELTANWQWVREQGTVTNAQGDVVANMHQVYHDVHSSKDAWTVGTRFHAGAKVTGYTYSKP